MDDAIAKAYEDARNTGMGFYRVVRDGDAVRRIWVPADDVFRYDVDSAVEDQRARSIDISRFLTPRSEVMDQKISPEMLKAQLAGDYSVQGMPALQPPEMLAIYDPMRKASDDDLYRELGQPPVSREAKLFEALRVLAQCHTQDDSRVGFCVQHMANTGLWVSDGEYIEAWKVVREFLHLPTEPQREG